MYTDFQECFSEGAVNTAAFNYNYDGALGSFEGPVEICVDGQYESVCDIGWDLTDALAVCRYQYYLNVGKKPYPYQCAIILHTKCIVLYLQWQSHCMAWVNLPQDMHREPLIAQNQITD